MLIKEVTKGMTIDTIKWEKNTCAHHDSLNNLLRIKGRPKSFGV